MQMKVSLIFFKIKKESMAFYKADVNLSSNFDYSL